MPDQPAPGEGHLTTTWLAFRLAPLVPPKFVIARAVLFRPKQSPCRVGDCFVAKSKSAPRNDGIYLLCRFVFAAQASNAVLIWKGVSSGCLARIRAVIPVMCGAAKLLPVQTRYCFLFHATSTSMPALALLTKWLY